MDQKLNKLIDIATKLRGAIEKWNKKKRIFASNLAGACGFASHSLVIMARKKRIYPTLISGYFDKYGHYWIEYKGTIIDITATQFDIDDKVYIRSTKDKRYAPLTVGRKAEHNVNLWSEDYDKYRKQILTHVDLL